jgi:hypothetical protein
VGDAAGGRRFPRPSAPLKGAEKNYNRNKTGKRVTQLGAGMNPSKLTNPQFFSQVRKKTFRKISNSKAEYPYPPTPTLGQGFASRLPRYRTHLKIKTLQAARRQVMKATQ